MKSPREDSQLDSSAPQEPQKEILLRASRFQVERVSRKLPDGQMFSREIVRHPGAVVILPLLDDGRICLIKNYRIAVNRELLELPAGTLEPNEPPIATAARELIEETGFRADSLTPLCEFFMSPGILDERMYAFLATGLVAGNPARELGEQITNYLVSPDELNELMREGRIQDSKSLTTILFYLRFHAK